MPKRISTKTAKNIRELLERSRRIEDAYDEFYKCLNGEDSEYAEMWLTTYLIVLDVDSFMGTSLDSKRWKLVRSKAKRRREARNANESDD